MYKTSSLGVHLRWYRDCSIRAMLVGKPMLYTRSEGIGMVEPAWLSGRKLDLSELRGKSPVWASEHVTGLKHSPSAECVTYQ